MTKSAAELYQSVILDHNRDPRGYGDVAGATHTADGFNPICGDKVTVTILVDTHNISDVGFTAQSCALCRASASVLMGSMRSMAVDDALVFINKFEDMISGRGDAVSGDAAAFAAIRDYPARAKCVSLPWKTFLSALTNSESGRVPAVSTEVGE